MRKWVWMVVVALMLAWAPRAHAGFGWDDAQEFGRKAISVGGIVIVLVDKGLHWSWEVLHNKIVHPLVKVGTLGVVDLGEPESE